jgi:abhydrolase domain-containing protein 12
MATQEPEHTSFALHSILPLTARLGANVLSVDYRGYGDSEGKPTVQGVSRDARTAWNYLISQGADPSDIVILGHSLGTAIAGILSSELSREGIRPRGTVLMAVVHSFKFYHLRLKRCFTFSLSHLSGS